ncbi:hypothetical protein CGRA01v4_02264 [Colletotrichum graminicola]|nr:hypothetical protein CGRA01v4_02264 [Colletotrichum graminicola]
MAGDASAHPGAGSRTRPSRRVCSTCFGGAGNDFSFIVLCFCGF